MLDLILKGDSAIEASDDTLKIQFGGGTCHTLAKQLFRRGNQKPIDPGLDGDLAILVARCVSDDIATQPRLQELVGKASEAVRTRTADYYLGRPEETDEDIRRTVQQLILEPEWVDPHKFAAYEIPAVEVDVDEIVEDIVMTTT
jgi:hypothetical protein